MPSLSPTPPAITLIARHKDATIGLFSLSAKTTGVENANNIEANTYSIISQLNKNDWIDSNGYYKFKIIWTRLSDNLKTEVIWKQSTWIWEYNIPQGFEILNGWVERPGILDCAKFVGLARSADPIAMVDGNGADHCGFNAVGHAQNRWEGGIPGINQQPARGFELYIYSPTSTSTSTTVNPTQVPSLSMYNINK